MTETRRNAKLAGLRLRVAGWLSWASIRIAPKEMTSVFTATANFLVAIPKQVEMGREGGVIIVPWSTTFYGEDMSRVMSYAALEAATEVRESWDRAARALTQELSDV